MAEGGALAVAAAPTPSASTSTSGVIVKLPILRNGINHAYDHNGTPNVQNRFNQENNSENTKVQTSTTHTDPNDGDSVGRNAHEQPSGVIVAKRRLKEIATDQNEADESIGVSIPTTTPTKIEIQTNQNKVGEQSVGGNVLTSTLTQIETKKNLAGEQSIGGSGPAKTPIKPKIEIIQTEATQGEVLVTQSSPVMVLPEPSGNIITREIVKSILYGGLTELIASLGIVTSAASTNTTTGKIVALSLATLITGLFVLSYKISEHWMKKHQTGPHEATDEEVDQYEELLGDRQNYRLHLTVATLSYLFFGLVPPLVYGFTFPKPEDKILKVSAVTIVTVLCTAILGVGKAYLQRAENCVVYIYIISGCIIDAIGTSVLTTIGGDLIEHFIKQGGWFEPDKIPTLFFPGIGFENRTWGTF